ncbi:MAG: osmoprotectant transport system permease protein [Chloroflexia bacterium]|jgi:osmoprotectant transport system permease protein|nr:osmoprotectant transport system permease protein [Chloroflexia bacterium]
MDTLQKALEYALAHSNDVVEKTWAHVLLSGAALLLAVAIGVPLGIWISRFGALARVTVNFAGVLRVVPSIAVLFLLLPLVGTGFRPSLIALTFLAVPPLLINTDAGMRSVAPAILEAGRGLGMSAWRLLWRVQLPLALPVVLVGLRRAAVEVIASATLATLIGGGGLGDFIQAGLALSRNDILLVGAIPVALLALLTELGLNYAERAALRRGA